MSDWNFGPGDDASDDSGSNDGYESQCPVFDPTPDSGDSCPNMAECDNCDWGPNS